MYSVVTRAVVVALGLAAPLASAMTTGDMTTTDATSMDTETATGEATTMPMDTSTMMETTTMMDTPTPTMDTSTAMATETATMEAPPERFVCVIQNEKVNGTIYFEQTADGATRVSGEVGGLSPGKHGFHVHQYGDLSKGCASMGKHYNPFNMTHGGPMDENRHVGDLGNIEAGEDGVATVDITDAIIMMSGEYNILGRGVVVHEGEDDLGMGDTPDSLTTGNAGARAGCCVIGLANPE